MWLGFVLAISFMEAWVKFLAPGVEYLQALRVGKIVFGALNKVEIVFASILVLLAVIQGVKKFKVSNGILGALVLILIVQSVVLLPKLSAIIDLKLSGKMVESGFLHVSYVALEVVKVILLWLHQYVYWKKSGI